MMRAPCGCLTHWLGKLAPFTAPRSACMIVRMGRFRSASGARFYLPLWRIHRSAARRHSFKTNKIKLLDIGTVVAVLFGETTP